MAADIVTSPLTYEIWNILLRFTYMLVFRRKAEQNRKKSQERGALRA
jgi:hypothetical protein